MSEETGHSWFERRVQGWYRRDQETPAERAGELAGIVAVSLLTVFFIYHQILGTGFFTSSFGTLEMFLFYLPVPLGIAVSITRMVTGQRNSARPLETASSVAWAAAGIWLFIVFPFDFARLGDVLPSSLQFVLSWIPDWLGRAILLIAGVAGLVETFYTPVIYFSVRRELTRQASTIRR